MEKQGPIMWSTTAAGLVCWAQKIAEMFQIVSRQIKVACLILLLIVPGCTKNSKTLPYYDSPDFTPLFISDKREADKAITHTIADFKFMDQHGNEITQKNIEDKIHVANFFFTRCNSICPAMTANMRTVNKAFAQDTTVVLLSYSVTPWTDNVATLKEYAQHEGVNGNWHLLTGKTSVIYALARQSYFAEESLGYSKDSSEFLHTEHFLLVDKQKRIRGIYNGTLRLEMQGLIADIQELKKE
jgi:protein SCO1/2